MQASIGDQEIDIIPIVKSITKYAVLVRDGSTIRYHLEKALYLARSGRPGPVWLDIPIDIQGSLIDPDTLAGFDPERKQDSQAPGKDPQRILEQAKSVLSRLSESQRPIVMVGAGVRLSGQHERFIRVIEGMGIGVTTCWNAHDALWNDHPLYCGRPGTIGDRAGNFAVQNSDFLLVLGSRLNIRQISYGWESFARAAYKVMVDADAGELAKPTLKIDRPIRADLGDWFGALESALDLIAWTPTPAHSSYLAWCKERVGRYSTTLPSYWDLKERVNPYCFVDALFQELPENEPIVTGNGTACVATFQAAHLKKGQRLYTNSGCASMGYDLPAAIGATLALRPKRLICITGDGSDESSRVADDPDPELTDQNFCAQQPRLSFDSPNETNDFSDNIVGCGTESGLGFPPMEGLAHAFGMPYARIGNHTEMAARIREVLLADGPQICEILLDLGQGFSPKLSSRKLPDGRMISAALEDMAPFLDREELESNMLIPLLDS